jgi:hypothetical protein
VVRCAIIRRVSARRRRSRSGQDVIGYPTGPFGDLQDQLSLARAAASELVKAIQLKEESQDDLERRGSSLVKHLLGVQAELDRLKRTSSET